MSLDEDESKKLKEIIETWDSVQAGIRIVTVIGNVAKWFAAIVVSVAAAFAAWHHK